MFTIALFLVAMNQNEHLFDSGENKKHIIVLFLNFNVGERLSPAWFLHTEIDNDC